MKKGVTLPIETVVVLLIAAIVLIALLVFFGLQWGGGTEKIELIRQQSDLCNRYVASDTECEDPYNVGAITTPLQDVCTKLDYSICKAGGERKPCILQCCLNCPQKSCEEDWSGSCKENKCTENEVQTSGECTGLKVCCVSVS